DAAGITDAFCVPQQLNKPVVSKDPIGTGEFRAPMQDVSRQTLYATLSAMASSRRFSLLLPSGRRGPGARQPKSEQCVANRTSASARTAAHLRKTLAQPA